MGNGRARYFTVVTCLLPNVVFEELVLDWVDEAVRAALPLLRSLVTIDVFVLMFLLRVFW